MTNNYIRKLQTEEEVREFISSHCGEINGLYHDDFYKMGGWNGLMGAINEVKKRYGVEIHLDSSSGEKDDDEDSNEDLFEKILREEL